MKSIFQLFTVMAMVSALCLGCATKREVSPPGGTDAGATVSFPEGDPNFKGFISGGFEVKAQEKANDLADLMREQHLASLWDRQATEAALTGKVIEPPQARVDGPSPVIFINFNRHRSRTISYEDASHGAVRHSFILAPNSSVVQYLQPGDHFVSVTDERGKQLLLRPHVEVSNGSRTSVRPAPGYVLSFEVYGTPREEYLGAQYFGRFSVN